jgi:ABC-type phosphate/phosphonate transport system substrate-binding protein
VVNEVENGSGTLQNHQFPADYSVDTMIASLPMYDGYVSYESSDTVWATIRDKSTKEQHLPKGLDKFSSCYTVWTAGTNLTLTQSCGYPLVREYSQFLKVLGTPLYSAPGCKGTNYRSAIIVRADDCDVSLAQYLSNRDGLTVATNSFGSFSGWLMLLSGLADSLGTASNAGRRKFTRVVVTGSHMGSMKAVQDGTADIAAIDCVSFALACNHCPLLLEGVRVIGWGLPAPALPFVTHSNASDEDVRCLRDGLVGLMQSTEQRVVEARQHHLLAGVDVSGSLSYEVYERAVQHHIAVAKSHPEVAALFTALPPGRPPRECFTVPVPAYWSLPADIVKVDLTSKLGDATWPAADSTMLHGLKRFLARYLWDTIHRACCAARGGETYISTAGKTSPIEDVLTEELLVSALVPIVGQQLWPTLPDGGKPKLIFCSLRGALLLLKGMDRASNADAEVKTVFNASYDDICSYTSWKTIARLARSALRKPAEASQSQPASDSLEQGDEPDFYWAGFMGAGAASLQQYFPEEYLTAENPSPENLQADPALNVISKLWDADIHLSTHLINVSRNGTNGMIAYISAPRHNDRGDWANLVITEDEAGIERWRDSRGHTSVRTHVAPHSYDHIRLHRGVLTGGLSGPKVVLKRTAFLGPVDKGGYVPQTATSAAEMDAEEKILSALRIAETTPAVGCPSMDGAQCPHGRGLQRHVVYWADVHDAHEDAQKTVPGGAHVTLAAFKQQLLNPEQSPFFFVDESMTSPVVV